MILAAFCAGRKNGNTEIYIKEALLAASEMGVECKLYRLNDFNLHTCRSCDSMPCPANGDPKACVFKDDGPFLVDEFLNSDGVIIGAPVYSYTPDSLFFAFRDRIFGPKMDMGGYEILKRPNPVLEGRAKHRPGALISVGGALTHHWVSLGLPSLYSSTVSAQTEIVDMMDVTGVANLGAAVLRPEDLERARQLGRAVANAMLTGDHTYVGDIQGACPTCHLNTVDLDMENQTCTCSVCGTRGYLKTVDGKITVEFPDDEYNRKENKTTLQGKANHLTETKWVRENVYFPNEEKALAGREKYAGIEQFTVKKSAKK